MKTAQLIYHTRDGWKLDKPENTQTGDPDNLESYYSPLSEVRIYMSTDEREQFELECKPVTLDTDVLEAGAFIALFSWCRQNARLRCFGAFPRNL